MVRKKKSLIMFLFMFFVMLYGFSLGNTCKAQVYYNLTDENLKNIFEFAKQQSIDLYPSSLEPNYTNNLNYWNTLESYSGDIRWNYIAERLNEYLYDVYSGDSNTQYYGDENLMVFFVPTDNGTNSIGHESFNFIFVPYDWRMIKIVESSSRTNSGETYFTHSMYINDSNGSGAAYLNMFVLLRINLSGDYQFIRDTTSYYSSVTNGFSLFNNSKYSWYNGTLWTYGYGILGLYHNDSTFKQKTIFYRPPGTSGNVRYQNYYNMNLDYNYIATSGDYEPTPTPEPTGSEGSTDNLLTDINSSLVNTPSGDDFSLPSSGDIINALNLPDISSDSKVTATDNFWLTITNGLYSALTSDVRYYDINFLGVTFTLDNQAFIITNSEFNSFLSIVQIVCFVFVEYKIIRKLVNMFASGVFSQIMRAYAKIDISDLF